MSLPLIFGVIIDGTKEYKRLIAGTKLGCIWQALHQERREDSNDCNAPTARLEMTDKVLGSHLGPVSYAYPIYIPSCPRLGNKALDDKKDFKLQPKRIILGLKWHRWHWHFWVSTGIPDGGGQCCHCPHVVCPVLGTGITVEWCKWSFVNLVGGLALLLHHSSSLAGWSTVCLHIWSYLVFLASDT